MPLVLQLLACNPGPKHAHETSENLPRDTAREALSLEGFQGLEGFKGFRGLRSAFNAKRGFEGGFQGSEGRLQGLEEGLQTLLSMPSGPATQRPSVRRTSTLSHPPTAQAYNMDQGMIELNVPEMCDHADETPAMPGRLHAAPEKHATTFRVSQDDAIKFQHNNKLTEVANAD